MQVGWIDPGRTLGATRGEVVVCIPVFGGHEHFVKCLRSVLAHTPAAIPILVCDDASPDRRSEDHVRQLEQTDDEHSLFYLRQPRNVGFPANVNTAFVAAAPADVVVLNSDCLVAAGWLEGLRAAAYCDSRVATVTTLTNHGTIVSVPERNAPVRELPGGWNLEDAAAAVREQSLRLRPRIPTAVGHCLYVRRSALELVGDFDLRFSPGYGEEVDFSQRCLRAGLSHVVADDVLVYHRGRGSFGDEAVSSSQAEHERMIAERYPYYHEAIQALEREGAGRLARALGTARRALTGLRVVIDGRILAGPMTGTQLHVLEVIAAVARTGEAQISVIVPSNLSSDSAQLLSGLEDVALITLRPGAREPALRRADVFHRPFQVSSPGDLSVAGQFGERMVLTQQDMIAFHNPAYFSSYDRWASYREMTSQALALADRVVFISEHAREDALADDLLEPGRASVVPNGVDHTLSAQLSSPTAPRRIADRLPPETDVMLCLGTDFRHKNRLFALRMVCELQRRHGWPGRLVLAGPSVTDGSSTVDETEYLNLHPEVSRSVLVLAAVSEAEKLWLLNRASLVLYPTVHEGFGLIPFEAARQGVPCMWAPGTSLSELLPDEVAGIVPWDAAASAENALAMMRPGPEREANLAAIRAAAADLTWDSAAQKLIEVYAATCARPATPASAIERRGGDPKEAISDDAMRLVGPRGALSADLERPLLALATHPQLGTPVFSTLKFGYRLAYRIRRQVSDSALTPRRRGQPAGERSRSTRNW